MIWGIFLFLRFTTELLFKPYSQFQLKCKKIKKKNYLFTRHPLWTNRQSKTIGLSRRCQRVVRWWWQQFSSVAKTASLVLDIQAMLLRCSNVHNMTFIGFMFGLQLLLFWNQHLPWSSLRNGGSVSACNWCTNPVHSNNIRTHFTELSVFILAALILCIAEVLIRFVFYIACFVIDAIKVRHVCVIWRKSYSLFFKCCELQKLVVFRPYDESTVKLKHNLNQSASRLESEWRRAICTCTHTPVTQFVSANQKWRKYRETNRTLRNYLSEARIRSK